MNSQTCRFRTAIFDLDGTLLNTLEDLWYSTNYALRESGFPERSLEEVRRFVGNGVRKLIDRAVPEHTPEEAKQRCETLFREHYSLHMKDHTRPYEGITAVLKELKESGCRIGVVSNKFDAAVKALCAEYFDGLYDTAIGESPLVAKKPAPDSVLTAMKELGGVRESCVYIGDSEVDIETSRNAGIPCIGVSWGFRGRKLLGELGAEYLCDIPSQLTAVILG